MNLFFKIFTFIVLIMVSNVNAYGIKYGSIDRPVTSAKLFKECDTINIYSDSYKLCRQWDEHIQYLESRLTSLCHDAGEVIIKKDIQIEGVVINHMDSYKSSIFHEWDMINHSYIQPKLARHYRKIEIKNKADEYMQYQIYNIRKGSLNYLFDIEKTSIRKPTLTYEISYQNLTSKKEKAEGLYGDLTEIKNINTGQIIAHRKFYYYVIKNIQTSKNNQFIRAPSRLRSIHHVIPCKNYSPKVDSSSVDLRPRTSYAFVSKVLTPILPTDNERLAIFDITKGMGRKTGKCIGPKALGPDVNPLNLELTRHDSQLKIAIKGTKDSLVCDQFFFGSRFNTTFIFYDGTRWSEKKFLPKINN